MVHHGESSNAYFAIQQDESGPPLLDVVHIGVKKLGMHFDDPRLHIVASNVLGRGHQSKEDYYLVVLEFHRDLAGDDLPLDTFTNHNVESMNVHGDIPS
jgi:hypothetical protein